MVATTKAVHFNIVLKLRRRVKVTIFKQFLIESGSVDTITNQNNSQKHIK